MQRCARAILSSAALWAAVLTVGVSLHNATIARAEPIDIAVVADGDTALTRATRAALIEQLGELSDFEYTFRFPAAWQRTHGWQLDSARDAIEAALAEDTIEIVVA
ncbi:MAG: hypothetical protein AAF772_09370, partial [Acidobacteriota bacterium]